jgi:predicted flap endonuclease-1-like 5' DNA nuclease
MATKTKKQANRLAKAKAIVKKINNDLIDASFQAIETTVKTGEKWQKLTQRLIKKAEPLTKQQMNMFVETAESLKGQLENGTDRLKDLVGFDQAKAMVENQPIVKKAEALKDKIEKEVSNNKLVKKAEKLTAKLKKDITNTIEDVKEKIEDYTEDIIEDVKEKVEDVIGTKKPTAKKSPTKKEVAKKVVAKKTTVKKAVKKVVVVKSKVKNDLKVIKGIGPKLEEALNSVGYTAYEQLAKTTIKDLTKVLSDAGINTKIYDLSGWKVQAKLALKGDMEAVANWKKK